MPACSRTKRIGAIGADHELAANAAAVAQLITAASASTLSRSQRAGATTSASRALHSASCRIVSSTVHASSGTPRCKPRTRYTRRGRRRRHAWRDGREPSAGSACQAPMRRRNSHCPGLRRRPGCRALRFRPRRALLVASSATANPRAAPPAGLRHRAPAHYDEVVLHEGFIIAHRCFSSMAN